MYDNGNFTLLPCENDRDGDETAFRKNDIGFQIFDQSAGFTEALKNTERIGKILNAEVAAEFPRGDTVIRNSKRFYQFLFYSVI